MLKEIRFQNFRCFKDLKIEGLQRFNIFGGKNNVGKTSLLEGIFISAGVLRPDLTIKLRVFRGIENIEFDAKELWKDIFRDQNLNSKIGVLTIDSNDFIRELQIELKQPESTKISSLAQDYNISGSSGYMKTSEDTNLELNYTYKDSNEQRFNVKGWIEKENMFFDKSPIENPYECIFINARWRNSRVEDAQRFGKIKNIKGERLVIDNLRIIDNRILDLSVSAYAGKFSIFCDLGYKYLVPIQLVGEGTVKYLSMLLAIANAENGIVLIDEIENGIHYEVLENLIESLNYLAEANNVQIFATTHSRELVEAAHRVFSKKEGYPFRYYRLDEVNGDIVAKGYDEDVLDAAIKGEWEIR